MNLESEEIAEPVPMGLPLANVRAHVLDDALNVVPIGVAGELYVGGAGVARGYRGDAGATAERFVPDPFGPPGERLYRTGDRVRCDRAGRLLFLGRSDDQIKLRGYRIELGEVARTLKSIKDVDDAVVVVRSIEGDERQQLLAYCVPRSGMVLESGRAQGTTVGTLAGLYGAVADRRAGSSAADAERQDRPEGASGTRQGIVGPSVCGSGRSDRTGNRRGAERGT